MDQSRSLLDEFRFYLENQTELGEKYEGKVLVIKRKEVIGVYEEKKRAVEEALKEHELGTFLVQECSPDPDSTKQIFNSRAILA